MRRLGTLVGATVFAAASTTPVFALQVTEDQSQLAAAYVCANIKTGWKCEVGPKSITMTNSDPRVQSDLAFAIVAMMRDTMCDQLYANMQGIHFADGWRLNVNNDAGLTLVSCPLDVY